MNDKNTLPRWDMSNVYPSLDSKELEEATQQFTQLIADLDKYLGDQIKPSLNPSLP